MDVVTNHTQLLCIARDPDVRLPLAESESPASASSGSCATSSRLDSSSRARRPRNRYVINRTARCDIPLRWNQVGALLDLLEPEHPRVGAGGRARTGSVPQRIPRLHRSSSLAEQPRVLHAGGLAGRELRVTAVERSSPCSCIGSRPADGQMLPTRQPWASARRACPRLRRLLMPASVVVAIQPVAPRAFDLALVVLARVTVDVPSIDSRR